MAVYTSVSAEEIADFIARYDVGEMVSFKGIAEGTENSNYMLKTTRSSYILTLFEKRVRQEDLPFFLGLMDHLAHKDISCATPVRDQKGEMLKTLCGRPAALISFLDGLSVNRPTSDQCHMLGAEQARMHLAAADFTLRRENSLSMAGWSDLVKKCAPKADGLEAGLQNLIEQEMDILQSRWPEDLPQGVIHADLFPDNVFFLDNRLSGLIDYYFACNDILAYDVAICLNAWCFEKDGSFNITKARSLLRGYDAVRKFNGAEIEALPILCRGAALRFLLTRLYDWQNRVEGALVSPHDPRDFIRKLKFHQAVRNAAEYGLDL